MLSTKCLFCDQLNHEGAKFCTDCGRPLYLQQSEREVSLDRAEADELDGLAVHRDESAATELFPGLLYSQYAVDPAAGRGAMSLWRKPEPRPLSNGAAWLLDHGQRRPGATGRVGLLLEAPRRHRLGVAAGALALAVLALPGYFLYRHYAGENDVSQPAAAGAGEVNPQRSATATSTTAANGIASPPAVQDLTRLIGPQNETPPAKTEPGVDAAPLAARAGAGASTSGAQARPDAPPAARQAAVSSAMARKTAEPKAKPKQTATAQGARGEARGSRVQTRSAALAAVPPTLTREGTRPRRDAPRIGPCTQAVAALGLCEPGPKSRGE